MGSITDWLTSIGTVSAVVISLIYTVFNHSVQKKRKRYNLIRRIHSLSERLFHEIETAPPNQTNISKLETHGVFKTYQQVLLFSVDEVNEDILILGEDILISLSDYFDERNETNRNACLDLMKKINEIK